MSRIVCHLLPSSSSCRVLSIECCSLSCWTCSCCLLQSRNWIIRLLLWHLLDSLVLVKIRNLACSCGGRSLLAIAILLSRILLCCLKVATRGGIMPLDGLVGYCLVTSINPRISTCWSLRLLLSTRATLVCLLRRLLPASRRLDLRGLRRVMLLWVIVGVIVRI